MKWRSEKYFFFIFLVGITLWGFSGLLCSQSVLDSISQEVERVFKKTKGAIVKVRASHASVILSGTGFFVDEKGHFLTARAIVENSSKISILYKKNSYQAKLVAQDRRSGLALLKISLKEPTPFIAFTQTPPPKLFAPVISLGYALGLPQSPSFGFVTGMDNHYGNNIFSVTHIRSTIPLHPGELGSPLLNTQGKALGVLVMSDPNGKFSYAIPSRATQKILSDFHLYGRARHAWVGVGVMKEDMEDNVVKVVHFFEGTPAQSSGLKKGDVILKIGKKLIQSPSDVIDISFFATPGEDISVVTLRDGKPMNFKFLLIERPEINQPTRLAPFSSPHLRQPEVIRVKASK